MSESINRNGFPRSGNFLSFLKLFTSLDKAQRKNVFISPGTEPGAFNYCVFPTPVAIPAHCERFIKAAEAVADIMSDDGGSLFPAVAH